MAMPLSPPEFAFLIGAGALAGGLNAIAGGGSLISFPALVATGIPTLPANATNAVALWPGSLSGVFGFRSHIGSVREYWYKLLLPAILGSVLGAWLLLNTAEVLFRQLVPVLILFATLLLAFQPRLKALGKKHALQMPPAAGFACQFAISVYGGYFGAGMGILMVAYLAWLIDADFHELNALKGWLAFWTNLVASGIFIIQRLVDWSALLPTAIGALVGAYGAARIAVRVNPEHVRRFVVVLGFALAIWFGWRAFQP